jgi:drug/metabolite transporter (DMT)-like permease
MTEIARRPPSLRTAALTCLALVAFAANSLLCRAALGPRAIDPASFSLIRVVSGALTLLALGGSGRRLGGDWPSALWLGLYLVPFALAYEHLDAGVGALLLFAAVQVTMILAGLSLGERLSPTHLVGLAVALIGLAYLVRPGGGAPSLHGAVLMVLSGVAWGRYSLRGRSAGAALAATRGNFLRCVPVVALVTVTLTGFGPVHYSARGVVLALCSGALASGLGYVIWTAALRDLTATRAASVQLAVPVIAGAGGVLVLSEPLTSRLLLASTLVLGGVALTLRSKLR